MPILKDPPVRRVASGPEPLRMSEAEFVKWSGEEGVRAEWVDGEVSVLVRQMIRNRKKRGSNHKRRQAANPSKRD